MKRRFPTIAEFILLRVLRDMPMTSEEMADHPIAMSPRGIAALLGRLRSLRYVEVEKVGPQTYETMAKRVYFITDDGRACLELAERLQLIEENDHG